MSIAFLEGAEYAYASEETVMTIDYASRYDDERLAQGNEYLIFDMRTDLTAAIDELRSTIAAQQDTIDDGAELLEQAQDIIADLQEQLQRKHDGMWSLLEACAATIDDLVAEKRAQRERIEELEAAIVSGQLYAGGCKP